MHSKKFFWPEICSKLDVDCIDIPNLSAVEEKFFQEHLCSKISKLQLKDAVVYYEQLLAENMTFTPQVFLNETRLFLPSNGRAFSWRTIL